MSVEVPTASTPEAPGASVSPLAGPTRVLSIDAFRGLVMFLMLAEVLRIPSLGRAFPDSAFFRFLAFHTSHVAWVGASLHDLIQPGFSLLVGAALPFSIANRLAKGHRFPSMLGHAVWRAVVLVLLGVFLRSLGRPQTYWTFEDTLSQIGLGYVPLFLLGFTRVRWQVTALVAILAGYWLAFTEFASEAPWEKNANLAWYFDTWFLNLFPREQPFTAHPGGYSTLSFIPTLGTMLLGLLAGEWLKTRRAAGEKLRGLLIGGIGLVGLGLAWHVSGSCPIVKRIWTPSFTLYSGGLVVLMLAAFYAVMEWKGRHRWAFPLLVIGMNSIAIYIVHWTMEGFFVDAINRHLGPMLAPALGPFWALIRGALVLAVFWMILLWMHRRKIYVRI